jgi:uncharacterized membrane protein (DUF106 family)
VNTALWLFIEFLNPFIMWFYPACDFLLGWTMNMGGLWGVVAIGVITGLGVNLYQKFFSRQKLLGNCKDDLDKLKGLMSDAKKAGNDDRHGQLMRISGRISGKYMWGSLKPAFITVPPIVVIAMWTGSRLGFKPVPPDKEVEVIAYFEDDAKGFARLIPINDEKAKGNLEITTAPVSPIALHVESEVELETRRRIAGNAWPGTWYIPWTWFNFNKNLSPSDRKKQRDTSVPPPLGQEARWKIKASAAGDYTLKLRYTAGDGPQELIIPMPVRDGNGLPPEFFTFSEFDSPLVDHLQTVQIGTFDVENFDRSADSIPVAWWNLWFQWMGLYVLVALVGGVGFRFALGVK